MDEIVGKLTTGQPLSIDQLIEYLPALKEIPRAQLDNWAAAENDWRRPCEFYRLRVLSRSKSDPKRGARQLRNQFW